jgi:hypothetical protein
MIDNVAQILKGIMDEESKKLDILSSNMLIASLKSNVNFKRNTNAKNVYFKCYFERIDRKSNI